MDNIGVISWLYRGIRFCLIKGRACGECMHHTLRRVGTFQLESFPVIKLGITTVRKPNALSLLDSDKVKRHALHKGHGIYYNRSNIGRSGSCSEQKKKLMPICFYLIMCFPKVYEKFLYYLLIFF